jgi:hypothetical protein
MRCLGIDEDPERLHRAYAVDLGRPPDREQAYSRRPRVKSAAPSGAKESVRLPGAFRENHLFRRQGDLDQGMKGRRETP